MKKKKKDHLSEREIYKSIRKAVPPSTRAIEDKRDKLRREQFKQDIASAGIGELGMPSEKVRVRFAPSPTGFLHIGGARTALYNWLFARHERGAFVLRIEDTDRARSTQQAIEAILNSLNWLGIDWDEGPYHQMDRISIYQQEAQKLLNAAKAYLCYCLPEEFEKRRKIALDKGKELGYDRRCLRLSAEEVRNLEKEGRKPSIRFLAPDTGRTIVRDLIRGEVTFENSLLEDFIIMRSDGIPTYNFAAVVDDSRMEITHVIRGEDHLSNTPKQILLYRELGYSLPIFAHLPMILGQDKSPLSKRHGATAVEEFRENGYLSEALVNYLALLGWSFDDATTVFSIDDLIEKFSLDRVSKSAAVFDLEKLDWMNGLYIRNLSVAELTERCLPFFRKAGYVNDSARVPVNNLKRLEKMVGLVQERVKKLSEVAPALELFFAKELIIDQELLEKVLKKEGARETLGSTHEVLLTIKNWHHSEIEEELRVLPSKLDLKPRIVFQIIRVATTGKTVSPPLFETLELLGKDEVLKRLELGRQLAS